MLARNSWANLYEFLEFTIVGYSQRLLGMDVPHGRLLCGRVLLDVAIQIPVYLNFDLRVAGGWRLSEG